MKDLPHQKRKFPDDKQFHDQKMDLHHMQIGHQRLFCQLHHGLTAGPDEVSKQKE